MTKTKNSRRWLGGLVLAGLVLAAEAALAQAAGDTVQPQRSELYRFASRFFWLIFPILGMVWGMVDLSARHRRAREGLQLIKSYVDQGKEPPPELLKFLGAGTESYGGSSRQRHYGWVAVFLFAGLTAAFALFGVVEGEGELRNMVPYFFVALIMGGMFMGLLVAQLARRRDDGRNLPQ